ncbi:uncharacterized protein L969DRAFT_557799 [Mixia osmundae IAM 14324]|uniref:Uncharacterized protein n=1 Tax=Mixia osmundae (strain CBS 9802 / IAM 14324 / JCM 22182 / KY 12970) TaxID=764103 RepID=G7DSI7_MIXOS|nr:uncharacterized protein L969DRAFT_557799 [Mixia osmundae IAM 14324]KEI37955.1 hypothetical protein L969DRAFT_557799 [Mixia osmundae IAM 14324]GAA93547.1 hypothetical protein E5Q_00191 [Mixia osmundae IAM 14324]
MDRDSDHIDSSGGSSPSSGHSTSPHSPSSPSAVREQQRNDTQMNDDVAWNDETQRALLASRRTSSGEQSPSATKHDDRMSWEDNARFARQPVSARGKSKRSAPAHPASSAAAFGADKLLDQDYAKDFPDPFVFDPARAPTTLFDRLPAEDPSKIKNPKQG